MLSCKCSVTSVRLLSKSAQRFNIMFGVFNSKDLTVNTIYKNRKKPNNSYFSWIFKF